MRETERERELQENVNKIGSNALENRLFADFLVTLVVVREEK
jgi:hypothetical protein